MITTICDSMRPWTKNFPGAAFDRIRGLTCPRLESGSPSGSIVVQTRHSLDRTPVAETERLTLFVVDSIEDAAACHRGGDDANQIPPILGGGQQIVKEMFRLLLTAVRHNDKHWVNSCPLACNRRFPAENAESG